MLSNIQTERIYCKTIFKYSFTWKQIKLIYMRNKLNTKNKFNLYPMEIPSPSYASHHFWPQQIICLDSSQTMTLTYVFFHYTDDVISCKQGILAKITQKDWFIQILVILP